MTDQDPTPSSLDPWRDAAFAALRILQRGGCDFADVYLEDTLSLRVKIEDRQPDEIVQGRELGAGLRWVRGDFTAFASTNDLTPAGLRQAAEVLVAQEPDRSVTVPEITLRRATHPLPAQPMTALNLQERINLALDAERAARAAGSHIHQVTVLLAGLRQRVAVARSDGQWCEDERNQVVLWVNAVAAQGQDIQTGYESVGGSVGWEFFQNHLPAQVGSLAGQRAQRLLTARPAPSGRMTVVLASAAGGTMIHEAIGHSLEADLVQKKLSPFGEQTGQAVASPLISVVDDATLEGWRGSFGFDDEGSPAQRTLLVEKGILRGFMHDQLTARQAGVSPTGNGRRQSYAHRPIPRMTNTLILPGSDSPDAILQSVSQGVYVVRMGGGQVNTVTGDFVFEISEGYLIHNGVLGDPIRGATLIGNGPQVLKSIDRLGSDLGMGIGTCCKDGQGVPVADAQPTLRIPEITVGGSS